MNESNLFRRVLVPLDMSQSAERALDVLYTIPVAGELLLVAVVSPEPSDERRAPSLVAARDYLQRTGAPLVESSWKFTPRVLGGDAAGEILRLAHEEAPSLVVMSTHGRSGFTRLVRGSVTERVLRNCPVPLLTLSPEARFNPPKTLLVPHDGSETADQILPSVISLARSFDAEVTLFQVSVPRFVSLQPARVEPNLSTPDRVEALLSAESLDRQLQVLSSAGVRAKIERAHDESVPARAILGAAERFDLVALASHGRSGWSRWSLGSTAESVLRACTRPVLVQRVAPSAGTRED